MKTALPKKRSASVPRFVMLTLVTIGLASLLLACGWATARGHGEVMLVIFAAAGLLTLAFVQRGAYIGILLLATMNGLPFIATTTPVTGKLKLQDVAVVLLMLTAVAWALADDAFDCQNRIGRILSRVGALLLVWWLFTLGRSITVQHVPVQTAADFCRQFAFFALLLILLPRVRLANRDIGALLTVLIAGVCLFAVAQTATALGFAHPGAFLHVGHTLQQSGLVRVYADMTDMVTAGLAASVAALLAARRSSARLLALPVALLLTVSTVVQLTRARWIGLVIALLVVALWLAFGSASRVPSKLRRRATLMIGVPLTLGLAVALIAPSITANGTVTQRLLSIGSELQSGGGTVAIRETVTHAMTAYLGEQWPVGLGFIPPSVHYFLGVPLGTIQDPDVGVLNAVVTMGVIGAALIYLPLLVTLIICLRRPTVPLTAQYDWLRYGGAIWIMATFVSSVTLVTLFSTSGLVLTAVILIILAHPSVSGVRTQTAALPSLQGVTGQHETHDLVRMSSASTGFSTT